MKILYIIFYALNDIQFQYTCELLAYDANSLEIT